MSALDRQLADAGVGLLSAVVTWVVFSATVSLLVVADALARTLPVEFSLGRSYAVESVGYVDVLWRTLSLWPFRLWGGAEGPWPTIEPVLETAPVTFQLLTVAAGLALFLAVPVVALAQVAEARRAAAALGLLAAVPAVSLVFLLVGVDPARTVEAGDFGGLLLPAVALALPLGVGLARLATLDTAGDPVRAARDLLLEGWLYVLWLPGALFVVETFFLVDGVTGLLDESLVQPHLAYLVQSTSLLVLPVLVVGCLRDLLLAFLRPASTGDPAADGGRAPVRRPLVRAVRESRPVQLGAGAFVALLLGGVVGTLALSEAGGRTADPTPAAIADGLWMTTGTALVALVVATTLGLAVGVASLGPGRRRHLPRLLDPVARVPSVVLLLGVAMGVVPLGTDLVAPVFGTVGGLAVAPAVARRYRCGVRDGDERSPTLAAVALATTGAGLVAFAVFQLVLLVSGLADLSFLPLGFRLPSLAGPVLAMVGLPVAATFLLGTGLRHHDAA